MDRDTRSAWLRVRRPVTTGRIACLLSAAGVLLMATSALLKETPKPTKDEIKESIEGNICRCTGYNSIVRAVEAVANGKYKEE